MMIKLPTQLISMQLLS